VYTPANGDHYVSQPNVIVVLVDQLRSFEVGCYGNETVRTPHIDRLAEKGYRFELGITNNPVCTPARSSLLTGQYSRTCTGTLNNVSDDPPCTTRRRLVDTTVAEAFRDAGYDTALIGKWHVDPDPSLVGFDDAYFPLTIHRYMGQRFIDNGTWTDPIQSFSPEHEMEKVDAFLGEERDKPFFLFYNISLPHEPIGPAEIPEHYTEMYTPSDMPLRDNVFVDGKKAHDERWFKIYRIWDYFWRMAGVPCWNAAPECGYPDPTTGELPSDALPDGFDLDALYALYYGATTCVDDLVGDLMSKLKDHNLDDNTIVLFTSDHGDNLGSHHLFNKDCLYEESIRVPFIVSGPGIANGKANESQIAQIIDIMPTLLDLSDVPIPDTVQGQSLADLVRGNSDSVSSNHAFIETDPSIYGHSCIGIRTPTHILGLALDDYWQNTTGHWGFFDIINDPMQKNNLYDPKDPGELQAALENQLKAWHTTTPWLSVED
jgi:choline-sulfatase